MRTGLKSVWKCEVCDRETEQVGSAGMPIGWQRAKMILPRGFGTREPEFDICDQCIPEEPSDAWLTGVKKTFAAAVRRLK